MFTGIFGQKMIFDEDTKIRAKFETIGWDKNSQKWMALDIPYQNCPPEMLSEHCFCHPDDFSVKRFKLIRIEVPKKVHK